jgi:hypothetical protein
VRKTGQNKEKGSKGKRREKVSIPLQIKQDSQCTFKVI